MHKSSALLRASLADDVATHVLCIPSMPTSMSNLLHDSCTIKPLYMGQTDPSLAKYDLPIRFLLWVYACTMISTLLSSHVHSRPPCTCCRSCMVMQDVLSCVQVRAKDARRAQMLGAVERRLGVTPPTPTQAHHNHKGSG